MDISFTERLGIIVALTDALTLSDGDVGRARDEARVLEADLYSRAGSKEVYEGLCEGLIAVKSAMPAQVLTGTLPEPEEADELFNPDGPIFGQYNESTFHRDGQMSTIFKAKALNPSAPSSIVALKVTTPSAMEPPHNSAREARLLATARHEHVVPLIESFSASGGRLVLAFPFLRQDLENLLRSGVLSNDQTGMVTNGLFSALAHVHSLGMIHRDVKPSNILLRSMKGPVYLADFGIAWSPVDPESEAVDKKITDVGTTSYRPPELLFGCQTYDTSLDMWAAGCVIAEMVKKDHSPLFDAGPLGSELGLIKSIFETLGTPTDETWPSAKEYPDWGKMRFQEFPGKSWQDIIPHSDADTIDLVGKLVKYESTARITAEEAERHAFALKSR
jgi:serine/threonine protein kinase